MKRPNCWMLLARAVGCYWFGVGAWWAISMVNQSIQPTRQIVPFVNRDTWVIRPAWWMGIGLAVLLAARIIYVAKRPGLHRYGTARWNKALEAAGLIKDPAVKGAKPAPRAKMVGRVRVDDDGATHVLLRLPSGLVFSQVRAQREQIAAHFEVPPSRVYIREHDGQAHMVKIIIYAQPPDLSAARQPAWIRHATDASENVTLGRNKLTGRNVTVQTVGNGADLIGGKNGSGKTILLRLLYLHFALDPNAIIFGGDGKGDPKDWRAVRHRAAKWVDLNDDDAANEYLKMLRLLHREVNRRFKVGGDHPWMLCLLEEATNLRDMLDDADQVRRADKELRQIVMKCRAANVVVVLAGQHPSAELMPTSIREQAGVRVCMHMPTPRAAEFVLGYQPALDELPTKEQVGHALMLLNGEPTKLVVDYVDDATWASIGASLPVVEPWKDLTLSLVKQDASDDEPQDAVPDDAPDPRAPIMIALEVALRATGRRMTTAELWNALPEDLRQANPARLGRYLSGLDVPSEQGRNGKLWSLDLLPQLPPQLPPRVRQELSDAEGG